MNKPDRIREAIDLIMSADKTGSPAERAQIRAAFDLVAIALMELGRIASALDGIAISLNAMRKR